VPDTAPAADSDVGRRRHVNWGIAISVACVSTNTNRHFEDARHYLKRAGEHAKKGVTEELAPVGERFRELTGDDEEPEPGRLDQIRPAPKPSRSVRKARPARRWPTLGTGFGPTAKPDPRSKP
jgi:hypothetical protein